VSRRYRWTWTAALLVACAAPAWANAVSFSPAALTLGVALLVVPAELLAIAIEAWSLKRWAGWSRRQAIAGSVFCNAASFVFGMGMGIAAGMMGGRDGWVTGPITAFIVTVAIEVLVATGMATTRGLDSQRTARVVVLTHFISWPLSVGLIPGLALLALRH
jgi:hypothetical protein